MQSKPYCPICQADNVAPHNRERWIFRCSSCSFDFTALPFDIEKDDLSQTESGEWLRNRDMDRGFQTYEDTLSAYGNGDGRSLLHVGCGSGSLLKFARDNGWNCFGIEPSPRARQKARARYKNAFFIVDSIDAMIPHEFDLIVMIDFIERIGDPCTELFYKLFSIGAITPRTEIIVSAPNARSSSALIGGSGQNSLSFPESLTHYSGEALKKLFEKLLFEKIAIEGIDSSGDEQSQPPLPADESALINADLRPYKRLLCKASGSTFKTFMQERYVPGTWSNLTKYEHLPRYLFAGRILSDYMNNNARVLDFGCGVGYGTRMIATKSNHMTGLDIDAKALAWATTYNGENNITYLKSETLGAELPSCTFDLIICFEVIEHVDQLTQRKLLASLKRLIKDTGMVLLSTPNPAVTAKYGQNAFHLHEMQQEEFKALIEEAFDAVIILEQYMAPSVTISRDRIPRSPAVSTADFDGFEHTAPPVAYIAVCSNNPFKNDLDFSYMDYEFDLVRTELYQRDRYYKVLGEILDLKNRA